MMSGDRARGLDAYDRYGMHDIADETFLVNGMIQHLAGLGHHAGFLAHGLGRDTLLPLLAGQGLTFAGQ